MNDVTRMLINKESYWLTLTLLHLEARHRPRDCSMFCIEKCKQLAIMVSSKAATLRMYIWKYLLIILEKSCIFQKICDIFYFGWLFTALQFSKCTKGLYKMNKNSIKGFLTVIRKYSYHYGHCMTMAFCHIPPFCSSSQKNFSGVLDFEDNFFHDKIFN